MSGKYVALRERFGITGDQWNSLLHAHASQAADPNEWLAETLEILQTFFQKNVSAAFQLSSDWHEVNVKLEAFPLYQLLRSEIDDDKCVVGLHLYVLKGGDINHTCNTGHCALHWTVIAGRRLSLQFLLEHTEALLNVPNSDGRTPLFFVRNETSDMAKSLVNHGAAIHFQDDKWFSPLISAISRQDEQVVRILIEDLGASVNYPREYNNKQTPLFAAIMMGDASMVELLLSLGADVDVQNCSGYTPLMFACHPMCLRHAKALDVLLALVQASNALTPSLINHWSTAGHTALCLAVLANRLDVARLLVQHGADAKKITIHPIRGTIICPLLEACQLSHGEKMVDFLLLECGLDVNCRIAGGCTPLEMCCSAGNENMVRHLLKRGAQVNVVSSLGECSALAAAIGEGNYEIMKILIEQGGANVNGVYYRGPSPLTMACSHKLHWKNGSAQEAVKLLLQHGADVNYSIPACYGPEFVTRSALEEACAWPDCSLLEVLVDHGCSLQNPNTNDSVTDIIGNSKNYETMEWLLQRGLDVNAANSFGLTPYLVAKHLVKDDILCSLILAKTTASIDMKKQDELERIFENKMQAIEMRNKNAVSLCEEII